MVSRTVYVLYMYVYINVSHSLPPSCSLESDVVPNSKIEDVFIVFLRH